MNLPNKITTFRMVLVVFLGGTFSRCDPCRQMDCAWNFYCGVPFRYGGW